MDMTDSERKAVEALRKAREEREGDSSWAKELPELPETPQGDHKTAIVIPDRGKQDEAE